MKRILEILSLLFMTAVWCGTASGAVFNEDINVNIPPTIVHEVQHGVTPAALKDMPIILPDEVEGGEVREIPLGTRWGLFNDQAADIPSTMDTAADTVVQDYAGAGADMPSPSKNFEGLNDNDNNQLWGSLLIPPDTNGDVGNNYYIQTVNLAFAIYRKDTGEKVYGPAAISSLWQGFGGMCETHDDGDPIVLYDPLAKRWLISQFALDFETPKFHQCIAVSQSGDPTGSWYLYDFLISNTKLNDYPKFGVWPDGYYMSINQFDGATFAWAGAGALVFQRQAMLKGQAASAIYWDLAEDFPWAGGMLPSDLDGPAPPPPGTPNYFVEVEDNAWSSFPDSLNICEAHVNWDNPSESYFSWSDTLTTAPFDSNMCNYWWGCIPQRDTSQKLSAISDRLMYRLAYRRFNDHESLVLNHTVDADGTDHAGIRWYELRKTHEKTTWPFITAFSSKSTGSSSWNIYQQGTYAPDSKHRWMGSIAMDAAGDIAIGYSTSASDQYPSIRAAGRLAGDPLGILAQSETVIQAGGGAQTHAERWGDYSSMSVDPVDDCTFWYTTEYYPQTSGWGWHTRIAAFKFPSCQCQNPNLVYAAPNPANPGQFVHIYGTGFGTDPLVFFSADSGWVEAQVIISNDWQINVIVPDGALTGPMWVFAGCKSNEYDFTVDSTAPIPPEAGFSADPRNGRYPLDVQFTDQSTHNPTGWLWDFGDGTTSTEQNPVHTYTAAGDYDVSLTVSNAGGSGTTTKEAYIHVLPPLAPKADFSAAPRNGAAPLSVQFTDLSTNNPTGWLWDFGDGTTSTEQNPAHTYAQTGTYDVTLQVLNDAGTSTVTKPAYINVTCNNPPHITYAAPNPAQPGRMVQIYGTGFGPNPQVFFNGEEASVGFHNDWMIMVTVPAGATSGPLTVVNEEGCPSNPYAFTILGGGPV